MLTHFSVEPNTKKECSNLERALSNQYKFPHFCEHTFTRIIFLSLLLDMKRSIYISALCGMSSLNIILERAKTLNNNSLCNVYSY